MLCWIVTKRQMKLILASTFFDRKLHTVFYHFFGMRCTLANNYANIMIGVLMFLLIGFAYGQEDCRTPDKRDGVCVPRVDCHSFDEYFERGRVLNEQEVNFLQMSICSRGPTRICCPDEILRIGMSIGSSTTTNTTAPRPGTDPIGSANLLPDPDKNECGFESLYRRILGGMEASLEDFPWYALLEYRRYNGSRVFNCGGSLINSRYVLTAAHCVTNANIDQGLYTLVNIRLGDHNVTSEVDCEGEEDDRVCNYPPQNVGFEEITVHPGYSKTARTHHHDIALIRLEQGVEMNEFVNPICLPDARFIPTKAGANITIAGYGHTGLKSRSEVKLKVQLPIVDQTQCQKKWLKYNLLDDQLCAGGLQNMDSCFGDSGGPLMTQGLFWTLEGVVSFGNGCGYEGWPGIYTRVSRYVEWIRSVVRP